MKDSERISNLEEMLAEILMRLDRAEAQINECRKSRTQTAKDISSLDEAMRELAKHMFRVDDRQTMVEDAIGNLAAAQKLIHESILSKEDLDRLFEFTMRRFDKADLRFDKMDARFEKMDARFNKMDARFDKMDLRFDKMDERFDKMEKRMDDMNTEMNNRFNQVTIRLDKMDERFDGIDLRLDNIAKRGDNPANSKF